jgi:hypothetical protein
MAPANSHFVSQSRALLQRSTLRCRVLLLARRGAQAAALADAVLNLLQSSLDNADILLLAVLELRTAQLQLLVALPELVVLLPAVLQRRLDLADILMELHSAAPT